MPFVSIRQLTERDGNRTIFGRELIGIADEVEQYPVQTVFIAQHPAVLEIKGIHRVADALGCHLGGKHVMHILHGLLHIRGCNVQFQFPALDAAHFQNVIDERQKVVAGSLNLVKKALHVFRKIRLPFRQFDIADDGIHGGADVMGHIEEECGFCPASLFCLRLGFQELRLLLF